MSTGGLPRSETTVPVGTDPPPPPVIDDDDLVPPDSPESPGDDSTEDGTDPEATGEGPDEDAASGDVVDGEDEGATSTSSPERSATGRVTIEDRGISVELGPGWEGEIYRRDPGRVAFDARVPVAARRQPTTRSVAHLANFPLPDDRGDYGSGAVEIMSTEDILVVLFEFEPDSATETMFAHDGIPAPLRPDDFHPDQMQRTMAGMAGVQRFFNVDGRRAFCLYIVIGDHARRARLTPRVNEVLADLTIT